MIPSAVPMLGHRITVEVIPLDQWQNGDEAVGLWIPTQHVIHIRGDLPDSLQYHTLLHEMLHAALDMMNHKLARNEEFVDQLAGLLSQALTGAEYQKPKRRRRKG